MISDTLIKIAKVAHDYVELLTWPIVALVAIVLYRNIIRALLPGAKVKIMISGVTLETTLPIIEHSITESLRGEELTEEQWSWLKNLHTQGQIKFSEAGLATLRPLRNAGLIRAHPKGFLQNAEAVKISTLGRLLVEASEHK
jgi:hypothetical protein